MKKINALIKASLEDFSNNKVRTALTSLGIMIGVFSVVMLIALGLGLRNYLEESFEGLGANLLIVFPGQGFGGEGGLTGSFSSLAGAVEFDERDYRSLQSIDAKYVVPGYITTLTVEANSEEVSAPIQGVTEDFFPIFNLQLIDGEFWDRSAVASASKVGVIAESLAEELFNDPEDAVGEFVRVKSLRVRIIGVVENIGDPEQDRSIMIPYTTTFASINTDKSFFAMYVGVENESDIISTKQKIEEILLERYEEDEFSVIEPSEVLETVNQIFAVINGILIAIGSISLVVGGIGIMNIMYASVTERTKEIGIRRAIGATKSDILLQFLTESVMLSVLGGVAGLAIAGLIVLGVRPFFPLAINFLAIAIAFGVSSLIGIIFGVFPARRAANLTPIEAIRYE